MEENIGQTPTPVIAESTPVPPISKPPFGSWWKVGGLVLGAVILAGGIFLAGYQYSQKQKITVAYPTITPAPISSSINQTTPSPTPTIDPTANWKTYNGKYFSLKYPPGWSLSERKPFREGDLDPVLQLSPATERSQIIFLYVVNNYNNLSIEEFVKENRGIDYPINFTPIVIGGVEGKRAAIATAFDTEAIYLKKDSKIYEINLIKGSGVEIKLELFNQILSTFKFLN